ncbi:uncharacterized protein LOC106644269 [Copidosoma floridanum]|uniref:uncharacterized protein LOC106644269 n=1 Tax=Copidosoma floridanum TaxID=29053 RepID=UPI0006C9A6C1|nr:uncharacterized protein LOC106644269 [Copidosoma floridanum]
MANPNAFIFVDTNTRYTLKVPSATPQCQYPSEWFEAHPNEKPNVQYTANTLTDDEVLGVVKWSIMQGGPININLVKRYIHIYFRDVTAVLPDRWESYGRVIGEANSNVNPWSLITVTPVAGMLPGVEAKPLSMEDRHWVALYCLCSARLARITIQQYADRVRDKIHEQIKLLTNRLPVFPAKDNYEPWAADPDYMKLIAAVDMFMYRFPTHPLAYVRVCTLGSRHKDCAGLLSIGYFAHTVSLENDSDFLDCMWSKKMATECINMMHETDHMMQEYSYFPYQSNLGLIR